MWPSILHKEGIGGDITHRCTNAWCISTPVVTYNVVFFQNPVVTRRNVDSGDRDRKYFAHISITSPSGVMTMSSEFQSNHYFINILTLFWGGPLYSYEHFSQFIVYHNFCHKMECPLGKISLHNNALLSVL